MQADTSCLETDRPGAVPTSFEVVVITELGGRFSGRSTFIEELEKAIPTYYDRVGQHLRKWVPPPPTIEKRDPTQNHGQARSDVEDKESDDGQSEVNPSQ